MYWFAFVEKQLRTGAVTDEDLALQAYAKWGLIQQKPEVIMQERANDAQMSSAVGTRLGRIPLISTKGLA